jgi:citrate synthase
MNTAAITSKITYIDGLKGVLRHRGYAIEELADKSDYLETAYLLVLSPNARLANFRFTANFRRKSKILFSEEKLCRIRTLQMI